MNGFSVDNLVRDSGYWYLATPYAKWATGLHNATKVAQFLTAQLMDRLIPVFSPIAHNHGVAQFLTVDKRNHDFWMAADKPMFDSAYGLLVADLEGWRESKGVGMEIDWARAAHKPAWLLHPTLLTISAL
jgi:hypothetical protein